MMRRMIPSPGLALAVALIGSVILPGAVISVRAEETTVISYDNLRDLLIAGNLDLQNDTDSYTTNLANYTQMVETLRTEQSYMQLLAKQYEDDEETAAEYKSSASSLSQAAEQLTKQITNMTRRNSTTVSVEKTIDGYEMTAQAQLVSYWQMSNNAAAKEKSVEAAQSTYDVTVRKQEAGAATAADVLSAADSLAQEKNQLSSYRQQTNTLRNSLFQLLGLTDDGTISIETVPAPDLEAIAAIDFETDSQKAVNNNSSVQSVRHNSATSMGAIERKANSETEAVGTVQASISDTYQQLLAQCSTYQAALEAFESSQITYNSLQLKQQAGMLSEADYLQGVADYLSAYADKESASMNLVQAYQSYLWEVKGVG